MNVIECSGLSKNYGRKKALYGMSAEIHENMITGLIGRNGAGKTTFLKIAAGFLKSTSGDIRVFSENPFNSLKVSANMIFIDDGMKFPLSICISDIIESAGSFYKNLDMRLAKALLDYFGLDPSECHKNLSKGMKSTFNSILGISARCALTIFDEPTNGMDAAVRRDFYRALLKDYVEFPRSIIISSHHLNEIEDILEDVLLIKEGKECLHVPVSDLSQMAIGIMGTTESVEKLAGSRAVYHKESVGRGSTYIVVQNNLTEEEIKSAKSAGIEISPVSSEDICVYLTDKAKGGIDSVFDRAKD